MATVYLDGDDLVVSMTRWQRIASLHVDFRVPRSSVRSARGVPDGLRELRGVRAPGTGIPGVLLYGTMRHNAGKDFCMVRGHGPAIELELEDNVFSRILVSDPHPETTIGLLGLAGSAGRAGGSAE